MAWHALRTRQVKLQKSFHRCNDTKMAEKDGEKEEKKRRKLWNINENETFAEANEIKSRKRRVKNT